MTPERSGHRHSKCFGFTTFSFSTLTGCLGPVMRILGGFAKSAEPFAQTTGEGILAPA
jgi:hypothetical protein